MDKSKRILISIVFAILIVFFSVVLVVVLYRYSKDLSGQRAYDDVKYQLGLGPRTLGSEAHEKEANWIISKLQSLKWEVDTQKTVISGVPIKNVIGRRGTGKPWIIIASHYDSRLYADQDLNFENRKLPVMGANDGASSVAILLELARVLPKTLEKQIWLVFFDGEDNGNISGYDWDLGSQYFVSVLTGMPDSVIIIDMVGDKDLNIFMERNSNLELNKEIWGVASELGYSQFILTYKYALIDDHIPFIRAGIKAVDVIDFNYPYWHTTQDTLDKISANSLKVVGETILKWLEINEMAK